MRRYRFCLRENTIRAVPSVPKTIAPGIVLSPNTSLIIEMAASKHIRRPRKSSEFSPLLMIPLSPSVFVKAFD